MKNSKDTYNVFFKSYSSKSLYFKRLDFMYGVR